MTVDDMLHDIPGDDDISLLLAAVPCECFAAAAAVAHVSLRPSPSLCHPLSHPSVPRRQNLSCAQILL